MREQLRRLGTPGPRIIGIDEVSIKKGIRTGLWSATWYGGTPSGSEGRRPLGSQHEWILSVAGAEEEPQDSLGGDGMEQLPQLENHI